MTPEQVRLDNIRIEVEALTAQAAERQRERQRFEDGEREDEPMGVVELEAAALERIGDYRAEAAMQGIDLVNPPADLNPAEGEPEGLSGDLRTEYRRLRFQIASIQEGE